MKRIHVFMDKMRERPVSERRRILFSSMVFFGVVIVLFGVSNIFHNLVSLNQHGSTNLAVAPEEGSKGLASVWSAIEDILKNLNDKLDMGAKDSDE